MTIRIWKIEFNLIVLGLLAVLSIFLGLLNNCRVPRERRVPPFGYVSPVTEGSAK